MNKTNTQQTTPGSAPEKIFTATEKAVRVKLGSIRHRLADMAEAIELAESAHDKRGFGKVRELMDEVAMDAETVTEILDELEQ